MARTALNITQTNVKGKVKPAPVAGDVANGNSLPYNDGQVYLEVVNGGAAPYTITFEIPGQVGGFGISQDIITVPNGQTWIIGPFPPAVFNQADGTVLIDVQNVALTLNAFHLG